MKLNAGYKYSLFLAVCITVVALCALPFFAVKKDIVYFYAKGRMLTSSERGFVKELKRQGFCVKVNATDFPPEKAIGFWVNTPELSQEISKSRARQNFLYTEDYYPLKKPPFASSFVVLTPYRELYEHYVRSNIKSAMFFLGVNTAEFFPSAEKKIYPLIYSGDNNQESFAANMLKQIPQTLFLGNFWEKGVPAIIPETDTEKGEILSQTRIVVVYNTPETAGAKKLPSEVAEAAAAGALVLSSPNPVLTDIYGDNVVIYTDEFDLKNKISHYLNATDITRRLADAAHKTTTEKASSAKAVFRFKQISAWLEKYTVPSGGFISSVWQ